MTSLDTELVDLSARVGTLSKRSLVALFWACSGALVTGFRAWASHRGEQTEAILLDALAVAHDFAANGAEPLSPASLLNALEAATPAGESPDEVSSTVAQDCWICADVGIRVLVDYSYAAGPAIEYALEPTLQAATEELYGVSQLATSGEEEAHVLVVLQHPKVAAAIGFCRWATEFLRDRPAPSEEDLALVRSRASVLAP